MNRHPGLPPVRDLQRLDARQGDPGPTRRKTRSEARNLRHGAILAPGYLWGPCVTSAATCKVLVNWHEAFGLDAPGAAPGSAARFPTDGTMPPWLGHGGRPPWLGWSQGDRARGQDEDATPGLRSHGPATALCTRFVPRPPGGPPHH